MIKTKHINKCIFAFFLVFDGTGVGTQGLVLARKDLYYVPSPRFFFT
jgi:hypothetical protein